MIPIKLYSFAKGIKNARKSKGLTQEELSDQLNVSLKTIQNWEQSIAVPEFQTILRLCDFFECDMAYLFNVLDCKTYDMQFIHEQTGLSENTIKKLISRKNHFTNYNKALDILIRSTNFENVLNHIIRYMDSVKVHNILAKQRRDRNEKILAENSWAEDGLTVCNYTGNDALDKKLKTAEAEMLTQEYHLDTNFRYTIQELRRAVREQKE
ncbi:MAG: helix-turn-helix transcriptional regulator [Eubacteriales bacterium]|nr:helix-turn-helix transcriptional regulator [Eubacteriales bacterium]